MPKVGWTQISVLSNGSHTCCGRAVHAIHVESFPSESESPGQQEEPEK